VGIRSRLYCSHECPHIATTIGFADGYPRELGQSRTGKVKYQGHLFPIAGNVCMDMLMVELGPEIKSAPVLKLWCKTRLFCGARR
jgi:alanine racemase